MYHGSSRPARQRHALRDGGLSRHCRCPAGTQNSLFFFFRVGKKPTISLKKIDLFLEQFRIHSSTNTKVLLNVASLPVIEHCTNLAFGAYPSFLLSTQPASFFFFFVSGTGTTWCWRRDMADNVSRCTRANILKSRISIGCEVVNHPIGVY